MSNPNIGVSFHAKDFNAEVRSMKEELSGVKKEFQITDEQLKRTGGTIDQLKNKASSYGEQLKIQTDLSQKYRQGVDGYSKALADAREKQKKVTDELTKAQKTKDTDEKTLKKLTQEVQKANRQAEIYEKKLKQAEKGLKDSTLQEEKLKTALQNTNDELKKQESYVGKVKTQLEEYNKKTKGLVQGLDSAGSALTKGVTVPLVAAAGATVAAMDAVDEGLDIVMQKTGATGAAAKELDKIYRDVAQTVPASFEDIGSAVGEINTRLDFTGEKLKTASVDFLQFAKVNGTDVNASIQLVTRAMGDAGIPAEEYRSILDMLTVAGQKSGISIDSLTTNLAKYGAPLRALGIDTKNAIAMFAGWEKAGVNTEIAFSGMKKAISNWGTDGKDARVEFSKTLDEIKKCPDIASATTKAIEVFGAKAGPDLADAIQGGRFEFEKYIEALENSQGAVVGTYGMIVDEVDDTALAIQTAQVAVHDIGETIAKSLGPVLKDCAEWLKGVTKKFDELDEGEKKTILTIGAVVMAIGPLLTVSAKLITAGQTLGAVMTGLSGPVGWTIAALAAVTAGCIAWSNSSKEAEQAFYNMGDAAEEASGKLSECETRVQTVDEMAEKYANLKEQIASGKLTEEELKVAEEQRAEAEQWFIDNYGDFISAEEQKNGIRDDSITKIQQYVEALREQSRLELEATVMENNANEQELQDKLTILKAENDEYEKRKKQILEEKIALLQYRNELQLLQDQSAQGIDVSDKIAAFQEKMYSIYGRAMPTVEYFDETVKAHNSELDILEQKMADNQVSIDDATLSLQQNAEARKYLIEITSGLNGSIEDNQEKLKELNDIQRDYNLTGQLSSEKLDALIKKFPELAGVKNNPELLKEKIKELEDGLQKAYEKADALKCGFDGWPTDIRTNVRVVYTPEGKVAGYSGAIGPLPAHSSGGKITETETAFVNEKGIELIEDKNGRFRYVESQGAALTVLSPGDTVYTAEESRRMMNARVVSVPGFASGTSAESQRKARVTAYKNNVKQFEAEDLRWEELQVDYGRFSDNDIAYALDARIKRYQNYMNEILTLDYMTAEEKDELLKEYSDKVEDLQLKQWQNEKELAKEDLDNKLELSEQYVAQIARSGDLAGDSWEAIVERVSSRYQKAVEDGVLTAEEAQKYIDGFTDTVYNEKVKNSERWIEDEVFYGRLDTQGQIDAWMRTLQDSIAAGDYERVREIEKKIYTLKKDYTEKLFDENLKKAEKYYDAERKKITDKYDEIDRLENEQERAEEKSDIASEMALYENAVTVEGKNRYNELAKQLQEIEKEEERERRELQEAEELEQLEQDWENYQESQNKALETMIQSYGMAGVGITEISNSVTGLIGGVMERLNQMNLDLFGKPLTSVVNYNNYYQTNNQRISDTGLANWYAGVSINQFKLGV